MEARQTARIKIQTSPLEGLLARAEHEFFEMPGLRLTASQARRLWGIDRDQCDRVLDTLIKRKFLTVGVDGRFVRLRDRTPRLKPAKATVTR